MNGMRNLPALKSTNNLGVAAWQPKSLGATLVY